jgi:methylmalonic aciduria homocystinuria type C protein
MLVNLNPDIHLKTEPCLALFFRPEDCPSLCNRGKKVYPVCLHPRYGGWFALRGVLIMTKLTSTQLQKKEPPVILRSENEIAELLELYNDHWRDWRFRDVIEVDERYSSDQIQYFDFPPGEQRWHLIKRILKEHETDVLEG